MGVIKKLIGQTAIYGMSTIIGRFLNFMLVPLYTRCFSQSEYGVVTELYSYTVFLMIFLTYGMETGFFRFVQNKEDQPKVFSTIMTSLFSSSFIFIGLVLIFLGPISNILGYANHQDFIMIMAVIIGIDAFTSVPFAKLRHENKAVKFAGIKLTNIAINIGLNLLLIIVLPQIAKTSSNAWLTEHFATPNVLWIFISNLIASIVTLLLLLPDIFKSRNGFDYSLLKRILSYSWPLLISGLAGSINEVYDRVSLRYFLTIPDGADASQYILSQVGIYGANYKLAMIISLFNQAFRFAAEPFFFSRMKENDSRQTYAKIMNYFTIFTLFIFLGIILYIDVFKLFIGTNFHDGLNIIPILLMANIFLGIVFNLSIWYKVTNQTKFGIGITGFGALITLGINMIFVPMYGYVACAWATLACYVLMAVLSYNLCQKHYGIPYKLGALAFYFILTGIIFVVNKYIIFDNLIVSYVFKTMLLVVFILMSVGNELRMMKLEK
ncbi:MAG: oligosaccharide flippase family protein [Bacteroidales bacterium]|nr:oligosaccharide flippase family protein [Bacteroidales bacterium]